MKTKKGFTLVELLVVIAIIGLLSTIAFVSLNRARAKARDAKRMADVRGIQSALELYYNDQATPSYPLADGVATTVLSGAGLDATYIATIPIAPTPVDAACTTTAENGYNYRSQVSQASSAVCVAGGCGWYQIGFCIGGATGGLNAGCVNATPSGIVNPVLPDGDCQTP